MSRLAFPKLVQLCLRKHQPYPLYHLLCVVPRQWQCSCTAAHPADKSQIYNQLQWSDPSSRMNTRSVSRYFLPGLRAVSTWHLDRVSRVIEDVTCKGYGGQAEVVRYTLKGCSRVPSVLPPGPYTASHTHQTAYQHRIASNSLQRSPCSLINSPNQAKGRSEWQSGTS